MKICFLQARCLEVAEYNRQVEAVKNKARVLFGQLCRLVDTVFRLGCAQGQVVQFLIDQQGGRLRYRSELQRMFPQMELKILKEDEGISSYQLQSKEGTMRLHFTAGADEQYLPVSLASMTAKLVRELMMNNLNLYFAEICGKIRPTAGYWQDGQRFIQDLSKCLGEGFAEKNILIRVR
jgi:ribonuclease HII